MNIKEYIKRNRESAWLLGILPNGYDDLVKGNIQWVSKGKYKNKWFADPFILEYDDKEVTVLVEEYDYAINRGRIAKIIIDRNSWTITDCVVILNLQTHLSFPVIYRKNGKIFVAPENNCSGGFYVYEYDTSLDKLVKPKEIMHKRLTDAVIYEKNGKNYLFTTYEPKPNGNVLTIYEANDFLGDYKVFQKETFQSNIARNAGQLFLYKGLLLRPAQESNYSYGHGLVFQRVSMEDGKFQFETIDYILSPHSKYSDGIHTYNEFNGMGIIDVKGDRNPYVGGFFKLAHKILVKIGLKRNVKLV